MKIGLAIVRDKLGMIVHSVEELIARRGAYLEKESCISQTSSSIVDDANAFKLPKNKVLIYCWRGGLRSASVAYLIKQCGYECATLKGGYKSFRKWARIQVGDEEQHSEPKDDISVELPSTAPDSEIKPKGLNSASDIALGVNVSGNQRESPILPLGSRFCVIGGRTGVGKVKCAN